MLFVALVAAILVLLIAIHPILIRARTLSRLPIAIAKILLTAILAGRLVFTLLVFMSFLVGHEIPPHILEDASDVPFRLITGELAFLRPGTPFC